MIDLFPKQPRLGPNDPIAGVFVVAEIDFQGQRFGVLH
jgi:hypothetical protein